MGSWNHNTVNRKIWFRLLVWIWNCELMAIKERCKRDGLWNVWQCSSHPESWTPQPATKNVAKQPTGPYALSRPCSLCLPSFCFISNRSVERRYVPRIDYHNVACILDKLRGTKCQCLASLHYHCFQAPEFDSIQDESSSLLHYTQSGLRIHPSFYPTSLLLDVKRPGTESGRLGSYNAYIKNMWIFLTVIHLYLHWHKSLYIVFPHVSPSEFRRMSATSWGHITSPACSGWLLFQL